MRNKKARKSRPMRNPCPNDKYVMVEKDELIGLIQAKTERDVLIYAAADGCDSSRLKDIAFALCKLNGGIEVKKC